jgi:hypothetical protein
MKVKREREELISEFEVVYLFLYQFEGSNRIDLEWLAFEVLE